MVLLTRANIISQTYEFYEYAINDTKAWHKFTIVDGCLEDKFLYIEALLNLAPTEEFVPCQFKRIVPGITFLARRCGLIIKKLLENNLFLQIQKDDVFGQVKQFSVRIFLKCEIQGVQSSIKENFVNVLQERMDTCTNILNLNRFHFDHNLTQYSALNNNKIFIYVLRISRAHNPTGILLKGNKLTTTVPLLAISDLNVTHLDLRSNSIADTKALNTLREFKLLSLNLDDNPICEKFETAESYIKTLKELIPTLTRIDAVDISEYSFKIEKPLHLCVNNKCVQDFVNTFLEKYFTVFDTSMRQNLHDLYANDAVLTVTRSCANHKRNRRICKKNNFIFKGQKEIGDTYKQWPLTQHEYYRFKINLMLYTPDAAVIVVNGRCREPVDNRLYHFSRMFYLKGNNYSNMCITNEILSRNCLHENNLTEPFLRSLDYTPVESQQNRAIELLKEITGMNEYWCKSYLVLYDFCVSTTMRIILEDCKIGIIPKEAFESIENESDALQQIKKCTFSTNSIRIFNSIVHGHEKKQKRLDKKRKCQFKTYFPLYETCSVSSTTDEP